MKNNFTPELIEKARLAKSSEDLIALAEANGITLTEDEAKAYFVQLSCNQSGELSDEELSNVSGGGCHYKDGRLIVTVGYGCFYFKCKVCGRGHISSSPSLPTCTLKSIPQFCNNCQSMQYEHGLWLCNDSRHTKKK